MLGVWICEGMQAHARQTLLHVLDALACAFKQFSDCLHSTTEKTEVTYLIQGHKASVWESQELAAAPSDSGS